MIRNIIIPLLLLLNSTCGAVTSGIEIEMSAFSIYREYSKLDPIVDNDFYQLHTDATAGNQFYCAEYSTTGGSEFTKIQETLTKIKGHIDSYIKTLKMYKPIFDSYTKIIEYESAQKEYNKFCAKRRNEINNLNIQDSTTDSPAAKMLREQIVSCAMFLKDNFIDQHDVRQKLYKLMNAEKTYDKSSIIDNEIVDELTQEVLEETNYIKVLGDKELLVLYKEILMVAHSKLFETRKLNSILQAEQTRLASQNKPYNTAAAMSSIKDPYIGYTFLKKCGDATGDSVLIRFSGYGLAVHTTVNDVKSEDIGLSLQMTINFKIADFPKLLYHFKNYKEMEGCKSVSMDNPNQSYCKRLELASRIIQVKLLEVPSNRFNMSDKEKFRTLRNNIFKYGLGKEEKEVIYTEESVVQQVYKRMHDKYSKDNGHECKNTKQEIIDDVIGLTMLAMSYGFDLFNGSDESDTLDNTTKQRTEQLKIFWYGPKIGVSFMSRNGFYALYENLKHPCKKVLFRNFINDVMCNDDVCDKMRLVTYKYGDNEYPVLPGKALSFSEWLRSIHTLDKNQEKVCSLKSKIPENKVDDFDEYFDCNFTDKLSPPESMTDEIVESYLKDVFQDFIDYPNFRNEHLKEKLYGVYGMGAYVKTEPGEVMIEIRSLVPGGVHIDYSNITQYIKDALGSFVFKVLDNNAPVAANVLKVDLKASTDDIYAHNDVMSNAAQNVDSLSAFVNSRSGSPIMQTPLLTSSNFNLPQPAYNSYGNSQGQQRTDNGFGASNPTNLAPSNFSRRSNFSMQQPPSQLINSAIIIVRDDNALLQQILSNQLGPQSQGPQLNQARMAAPNTHNAGQAGRIQRAGDNVIFADSERERYNAANRNHGNAGFNRNSLLI